ncbi:two-component sensor histidine kinase [Kaistella flava (ex Peng et al. 2021)]|uniref:Two-component sensor histidine kinase n=1 Tax=Kaistella flava (ex Peng et al. 2021) TaxID=2038776 RepID=A0A7M2YC64_9FLAO|nr:histidine kinase [Kaistella flava (ex Peng et al. 2021)]QOW11711.1 two-component sensor histidine kinase [Kaistella flava (ex Peng et al. 2021)]
MKSSLPFEIKLTYFLAVVLLVVFVGFLIFIVVLSNRKQVISQKENELKDAEFKNILLQKEIEVQKEAERERLRISRDMHDDFGSGISALKLQVEFLKLSKHEGFLDEHINDLLKSCDDLNHSMREMLWGLNSTNDSLESLVNYVTIYAVNFFKKTKIKPHIQNAGYQNKIIGAVTRRNLYLCVKEALNNIYKHSLAENVIISFEQVEHQFIIDIIDDGVGLKPESPCGNGFANMDSRMNSMNGEFRIVPSEVGLHLQFVLQL